MNEMGPGSEYERAGIKGEFSIASRLYLKNAHGVNGVFDSRVGAFRPHDQNGGNLHHAGREGQHRLRKYDGAEKLARAFARILPVLPDMTHYVGKGAGSLRVWMRFVSSKSKCWAASVIRVSMLPKQWAAGHLTITTARPVISGGAAKERLVSSGM